MPTKISLFSSPNTILQSLAFVEATRLHTKSRHYVAQSVVLDVPKPKQKRKMVPVEKLDSILFE